MEITSMNPADFGNKQGVSNQPNSTISGVIMVLQCMYLRRKGNVEILLKIIQVLKPTSAKHYIRYI
jgi:hypothetical protein